MSAIKKVSDPRLFRHATDTRPANSGVGNSGVTPTRNAPAKILPQAIVQSKRDEHGKTGGKLVNVKPHVRHQGTLKNHR